MKSHPNFRLNGISYTSEELRSQAVIRLKDTSTCLCSVGDFLSKWLDGSDRVLVKTSGSTGTPKTISLSKTSMSVSALKTIEFFDLKPGIKALLCLPVSFVAGKMMLLRAMLGGWDLTVVKPSSKPLEGVEESYDFCAMTPMQVSYSLNDLNRIKKLIVGGAPLHRDLIKSLKKNTTQIYETYGMTETITHIAVKNISGGESYFRSMQGVSLSGDSRDRLVIYAPYLSDNPIRTNDIVSLQNNTFKWLGRYDNIINSGGVKLIPEQIEEKLEALPFRYFITAVEDDILGEKPVLVIEQDHTDLRQIKNALEKIPKIERPSEVYYKSEFAVLKSGKIDRSASFTEAQKLLAL